MWFQNYVKILFGFCLVVMIGITYSWISKSELNKLTIPFDSNLRACGFEELKEYPFIYFPKLDNHYLYFQNVCVKECPILKDQSIDCKPNYFVKDCQFNNRNETYVTSQEFGKVCLPIDETGYNQISPALQISSIEQTILTLEKKKYSITVSTLISFLCIFVVFKQESFRMDFIKRKFFDFYNFCLILMVVFGVLFFKLFLYENLSISPWPTKAKESPQLYYRNRFIRENRDDKLHVFIAIVIVAVILYYFRKQNQINELSTNQDDGDIKYCIMANEIISKGGIILVVFLVLLFTIGTLFVFLEIEKHIFAVRIENKDMQLFLNPFNKHYETFSGLQYNIIFLIPVFSWILSFFSTFVEYVTAIQTFRYIILFKPEAFNKLTNQIFKEEIHFKEFKNFQMSFCEIQLILLEHFGEIGRHSLFSCFGLLISFIENLNPLRLDPYFRNKKLYLDIFMNYFSKIEINFFELDQQMSSHPQYKKVSFGIFFEDILRYILSLIPTLIYMIYESLINEYYDPAYNQLDKKLAPLLVVFAASYVISSIVTTVFRTSYQYSIQYTILIDVLLEKDSIDQREQSYLSIENNDSIQLNVSDRTTDSSIIFKESNILILKPEEEIKLNKSILIQNLYETKVFKDISTESNQNEIYRKQELEKQRKQELKHAALIFKDLRQEEIKKQFAKLFQNGCFNMSESDSNSTQDDSILQENHMIISKDIISSLNIQKEEIQSLNEGKASVQDAVFSIEVDLIESEKKSPSELQALQKQTEKTRNKLSNDIQNSSDINEKAQSIALLSFYDNFEKQGHQPNLTDSTTNKDLIQQIQEQHLNESESSGYFNFSAKINDENNNFEVNHEQLVLKKVKDSLSEYLDLEINQIQFFKFKFDSESKMVTAKYRVDQVLIEKVQQKCNKIGNSFKLDYFNEVNITFGSLLAHFQISPDIFDLSINGGIKIFPEPSDKQQQKQQYRGKLPMGLEKYKGSIKQKYYKPYGWVGLNLNVKHYGDNPQGWFQKNYSKETFVVLYHATRGAYVSPILDSMHLRAGNLNAYGGEKCRLTGMYISNNADAFGNTNLYLADDIKQSIPYADRDGFEIGGKKYQFIFQCRVNPNHVRSPISNPNYYTVESKYTSRSVRPYRLLFREITK